MDASSILLHLAIVLVAARVAAEVAERAGFPAVLAEILAGVALGPSALGLIGGDDFLRSLGELGVILLMFEVGRQMDLTELARVGGASMAVAGLGVAVPMAGGYIAMRALGIDHTVAIFLGAGITATSVGLTARIFGDLRMLASTEARTVLGAAVADDVIGLLVLTVVVGMVSDGGVSTGSVAVTAVTAIGFVVAATMLGVWLVPRALRSVSMRARTDATLMALGLAFALGVARLASAARLAPIVGAFVAGLAVARSDARDELHRRLAPVGQLLIPIFFIQIGIDTRLSVFADRRVLWIAAVLSAVAIAGKLVSGLGISSARADRLLVGIGMVPRGEVGLIFAGIGLSSGILNARDYGALVFVVLLSSIVCAPMLRARSRRTRAAAIEMATEVIEPAGGWLTSDGRSVELAAMPPPTLAAMIALDAAVACSSRRPGERLLASLSASPADAVWDARLRARFMNLLREGNERSWRFLDVTGALHTLLPELARAMRGAPDELSLEPSMHLEVLAGLQTAARDDRVEHELAQIARADAVYLAALARSAFEHERDPAASAARLATTIGCDEAEGAFVAFLVAERHLLPAAAARLDMGTEESVLALAAHIGTLEHARALYVLAVAEDAMESWERERLDELYALVADALAHPDLTGAAAESLVEQRRRAAAAHLTHLPVAWVQRHLEAAPRRYLLAQDPAAIERHVGMLEHPLGRDEVRLRAEEIELGAWTLDVVALDRPGLLAAIAGALADYRVAIEDAFVSTWRPGVAIDVFRVRAPQNTDWEAVRRDVELLLARGFVSAPGPIDGVLSIDNRASPWHTIVEVQARDRAGLLHRMASALSHAGLQIDSASVTTRDGVAVDTFWVTGPGGGKLDAAGERALRDAFAGQTRRRWRAPWRSALRVSSGA